MRDFLIPIAFALTAMVLVFVAVVLIISAVEQLACTEISEETGLETKHRLASGCYVRDGDRWVHWEKWKQR